jgi:hypothetical protein
MRKWLLCVAVGFVLAAPSASEASLLEDYFGVTLETGSVTVGSDTYDDVFIHSWMPSLHTGTTDFVYDDWYGKEALSFEPHVTLFGSVPSGGEVFDVEAYFLDNDAGFLYLSIVTSFPPEGFTHPQIPDVHVPPGDIAIGLDGGMYDFGIDVSDGTGLLYATDVSDWFIWDPPHCVPAQGELTLFSGGTLIGPTNLTYESAGIVENEFDTYLIEVALPLEMLGYPQCGTSIYIHWVCGCRNDASGENPILKLFGLLEGGTTGTEQASWGSVKALFR